MNQKPASLHLAPQPSRYLLAFLSILHLGAALCILMTDLSYSLKCALLPFPLLSTLHTLRRKKITHLSVSGDENQQWEITYEQGETQTTHLCPDSVSTAWFVLLRFKQAQPMARKRWLPYPSSCSIVLPIDALSQDSYRRLRLYLFFS